MLGSTVRGTDVVQDNVTDCSVVAALIVAAEHHARHRSKVRFSTSGPPLVADVRAQRSSPSRASSRKMSRACPCRAQMAATAHASSSTGPGARCVNVLCTRERGRTDTLPTRSVRRDRGDLTNLRRANPPSDSQTSTTASPSLPRDSPCSPRRGSMISCGLRSSKRRCVALALLVTAPPLIGSFTQYLSLMGGYDFSGSCVWTPAYGRVKRR